MVFTSDISISKITKDKFSSEVYEDKAERICFCSAIAYARSSYVCAYAHADAYSHASVDLLVLSFVLPCAYGYAYVASENQA